MSGQSMEITEALRVPQREREKESGAQKATLIGVGVEGETTTRSFCIAF